MRDFVIVTDSCSDLDKELRQKYNIDYIPMTIFHDGIEQIGDLDWQEFSAKEFYDNMRKGIQYKTAQINADSYTKHFEKYLQQGLDILSISASSALSGSVNTSRSVKNSLSAKYPEAKIYCIDALIGCMGEGLLCCLAAEQKAQGKNINEVAQWVEENKLKINQASTVDDLKYLKRAGRVTGMAAFMAGVLDIKPLIISNVKGENQSVQKIKGRKASMRRIVEYVKERIVNPEKQTLFLSHGDCINEALELKNMLMEAVPVKDVYINYVGCVVGSTTGPGMMAVYFEGVEVDESASIVS